MGPSSTIVRTSGSPHSPADYLLNETPVSLLKAGPCICPIRQQNALRQKRPVAYMGSDVGDRVLHGTGRFPSNKDLIGLHEHVNQVRVQFGRRVIPVRHRSLDSAVKLREDVATLGDDIDDRKVLLAPPPASFQDWGDHVVPRRSDDAVRRPDAMGIAVCGRQLPQVPAAHSASAWP